MKRIKDISKRAPRIRDTSRREPRIDPSVVAAAIGGQVIGRLPVGLDPSAFVALRREIMARLVSSGGRPGLEDAVRRQKIPLAEADWARLVEIADHMSTQEPRPTPGQIASALIRIALSRPDLLERAVPAAAPPATHAKEGAATYRTRSQGYLTLVEGIAKAYASQLQALREHSPSPELRSAVESLLEATDAALTAWLRETRSRF